MRTENYNYPNNQQNGNGRGDFNPTPAFAPTVQKAVCGRKSMADALKLVCTSPISNYMDFNKFAFLSPAFLVGTKLILIEPGDGVKDNLAELTGEFRRFTVGNCDTIDISGTAVYNIPIPFSLMELKEDILEFLGTTIDLLRETEGVDTLLSVLEEILMLLQVEDLCEAILEAILKFLINWFTVLPEINQAALCKLQSVAFELESVDDYNTVKELLQKSLECTNGRTHDSVGRCDADRNCSDGVAFALLSANASNIVTLTAGNLILREVKALGNIGNVLVFGNEREGRFYFVCANAVQFLG